MSRFLTFAPLTLLTALALAACQEPLAPESPAGAVPLVFGAPAAAPEAEALLPWSTPTSVLNERQQLALQQVRENSERVFSSNPPVEVLDEIELVFFGAAASHELAGYYRAAADAAGPSAAIRPRLAWHYLFLGLLTAAEQQAEMAVEHRPDDAQAWFVRGFVRARLAGTDAALQAGARADFERALALAPDFVGPAGFTAETVRNEIAQLSAAPPTP